MSFESAGSSGFASPLSSTCMPSFAIRLDFSFCGPFLPSMAFGVLLVPQQPEEQHGFRASLDKRSPSLSKARTVNGFAACNRIQKGRCLYPVIVLVTEDRT